MTANRGIALIRKEDIEFIQKQVKKQEF